MALPRYIYTLHSHLTYVAKEKEKQTKKGILMIPRVFLLLVSIAVAIARMAGNEIGEKEEEKFTIALVSDCIDLYDRWSNQHQDGIMHALFRTPLPERTTQFITVVCFHPRSL